MSGVFITFEGGEGTGKSTQIKRLAEAFRGKGRDVVVTREPGGTPEAETLRNLLVSGDPGRWSAEAEALLNYAARDSHLRGIIRPALAAHKTVLCDRFMDSTRAYQGYAGNCSMALLDGLEAAIVAHSRPDLTLILDLDPLEGLKRANSRGTSVENRYERKDVDFHNRLREGFLKIARFEPNRCHVVDANGTVDEVSQRISAVLEQSFHG